MKTRPDFSKIKSYSEFSQYYWYRDELKKICKALGIASTGMKAELNHNLEEYFNGRLISSPASTQKMNKAVRTKATEAELTLDTSLIECDFRFNERFRNFFSEQTNSKRFKFTVDMVASARKAKQTGDTSFTLGDLLDIYLGKKTYAKYDKVSLQWNKFVKDFCADPSTNIYKNRLKAAAALWKTVRESTFEKVYKTELLKTFDYKEKQND